MPNPSENERHENPANSKKPGSHGRHDHPRQTTGLPNDSTSDGTGSPQSGHHSQEQFAKALQFVNQVRLDLLGGAELESAGQTVDSTKRNLRGNAAAPSSREDASRIPEFIGRFEVLRPLGQGGFAKVYLARDPRLDRLVALKVPKTTALASLEAQQRFEREALAAAALNHPNIVPIFETGKFDQQHFIASQYCAGESLGDWFEEQQREIPCLLTAAIVERLAEAVHHAHQRGVIHRDLKPANILLDLETEEEAISPDRLVSALRVTDFGLARYDHNDDGMLTTEGAIVGTPAYMSPEQAKGAQTIDEKSDVYSLGVILYELLTGKLPHVGETHIATLRAVEFNEPISPSRHRRDIPRDLEAICLKALSKSASLRYESAFALAEDLNRWLSGKVVSARRITPLGRAAKWSRRNPLVAGALGFAAVSLIIGSLFGAWHWNKSNRSSRIAESQSNRADAHLARLTGMIDALLAEIESPAQAGLVTADQRKRLNEILAMQRALINEESDDSASFRNTLRAYSRSTSVYAALGEYERCVQLAREAHKWLGRPDQWKTRDPSIDTDVLELVFDLHLEEMEALDRSNQPAKATEIVDWLDETLDQFRDLFSESEYLYYRLVFVNRRGLAYRSMNLPTKALNCHEEGQRRGRLLESTTGPNVDTTVAIASNLINLASRYGDSSLREKASETKAEAVQILDNAIAETPSDYSLLRLRAMARSNWGSDLIRLGRLEDAKRQLDLAISEFEILVAEVPGNISYLESLAVAILRAASLAIRFNDPSQALRYCQSAIDLEETGLDNTLKGKRILVSAWDQKSYLQFSANNSKRQLNRPKPPFS